MNIFSQSFLSGTESLYIRYISAFPYPHIVIDNFLKREIATEAMKEFPGIAADRWIHYLHYNEKKHGLNNLEYLPEVFRLLIKQLNSIEFLKILSGITGIKNLHADETLEGGGLHQSSRGGFLNIHADFTVHPHHSHWQRRVNLLIYFNKEWEPEWGGDLELWDNQMHRCEQKISPVFNRCVIFNTDADSFHGFPDPIQCPDGITRKSLALYYYTHEKVKPRKIATNYMGRPDDGFRKRLIWADKKLLSLYNSLKGVLNLNDDFASNLLRKLSRKK